MTANLGYHFNMRRLNGALIAGFGVLCLALVVPQPGFAQINGVPASVTSIGFGGHPGPHGVPPSVTSIGPRGLVPNNTQFPLPGTCCINPLFPSQPNPGMNHHHHNGGHDGHHHLNNFGYGYGYAVPYAVPSYDYTDDASADSAAAEPYAGGPTIFDRRGSGQLAPYQVSQYAPPVAAAALQPQSAEASEEPATEQPQTILVFKDGHQVEVSNYAIVGTMLYDLTPGHTRKVPLADLNLPATSQQNDDRGIDFQLPGNAAAN
ncbi:MAG TPA: hypothetical protein VJQ82_12920 [Terriglobales bacterium]|nr:hypothetical protein [Terriglobales bacterium]